MARAQDIPSSLDGLFGDIQRDIQRDSRGQERKSAVLEGEVRRIPLEETHGFKGHPFRVEDDEKMEELKASIEKYGVLEPGIARPRPEGGYEVISGHRRRYAAQKAGKKDMPFLIREYTDDEATVIMVDSNIQRENLLPSEKAWAYRMKHDALKHQGSGGGKHTADIVGEAAGDSGRTVQRYIRLTYLLQELLNYVDKGKLKFVEGVALSFFTKENQKCVLDFYESNGIFPTEAQLKGELSQAGELDYNLLFEVLCRKEQKGRTFRLKEETIAEYFPEEYSEKEIQEIILKLLDEWNKGGRGR